jgi:ArsR family transcriptional regulator
MGQALVCGAINFTKVSPANNSHFDYYRSMESDSATLALGALAHRTRLSIFRHLVRAGPDGLCAGDIAVLEAVPASTLSHHLAGLERAGLLRSWRMSRQIFYAAEFEAMRRLVDFLTRDCCLGQPELCGVSAPACPGAFDEAKS